MNQSSFLQMYRKIKNKELENGKYLTPEGVSGSRKFSGFTDLDGLILLSDLIKEDSKKEKIVSKAFYDTLFFNVSTKDLHNNISEYDIHDLIALGIFYDESKDLFFKYL